MAVNLSKEKQEHDNPVVMDFENMVEYHGDLVPKTRLEVFDNKDKKPICLTKSEDISCNTEIKKEAELHKTDSKSSEYLFWIESICMLIMLVIIPYGILYLVRNFEDICNSVYDIAINIAMKIKMIPIILGIIIGILKQISKMKDILDNRKGK